MRALCAVLVVVALLAGCGQNELGGGNARKGGTLTIGWSSRPDSLDPALAATSESREALWLVYTPLLTYKRAEGRDGTKLIPGLAERMPSISSDGRTYRLRLRRGLRYSDRSRVRARDFVHAIDRLLRLDSPLRAFYRGIDAMHADDRTGEISVRLRRPDATFLNVLALPSSAPLPARTPFADRDFRPPPGVGPFVIRRRYRDGGFLMRRDRRFHLPGIPGANVDQITVRVGGSRARRAREVIDGHLDYMQDAPPAKQLPELRSKYEDRYGEHASGSTYFYFLNTRRPPFDERRVREAVAYAVDGDKLRRLFEGRLDLSCNYLPSSVPGYRRLDPCPYGARTAQPNLEKARSLVLKAGQHAAKVTVWGPADGNGPRITRYYAGTLRKLGLDAEPRVGSGAIPDRAQTAVEVRFGDLPNPVSYFEALAGRTGDREVDATIDRLRLEPHPDQVADQWADLDRHVVERAYVAPFGSQTVSTFLSERLDFENCARFHPVYGNDYSSFCLK